MNEILGRDGRCTACPFGSKPDAAGQDARTCVKLVCGPRERIASNGKDCEECPSYTRVSDDKL